MKKKFVQKDYLLVLELLFMAGLLSLISLMPCMSVWLLWFLMGYFNFEFLFSVVFFFALYGVDFSQIYSSSVLYLCYFFLFGLASRGGTSINYEDVLISRLVISQSKSISLMVIGPLCDALIFYLLILSINYIYFKLQI